MARYSNVVGVERIERQFKAMSREAAEEVAKALNKSAEEVADRARMLAPSGKERSPASRQYGPLRESIDVSMVTTLRGNIAAKVSTGRAFYARFVEFGTRGNPGRPFFFPAFWSVRKRVRGRVARALNKAAKAAVRR